MMDNLLISGRATIAAIVTAFAMWGFSIALDLGLMGPSVFSVIPSAYLLLVGPFVGGLAARLVLSDIRYFRPSVISVAALIGLFLGILTRHDPAWTFPLRNTVWVASWTFAGAFVGVLWKRSRPEEGRRVPVGYLLLLVPVLVPWPQVVMRNSTRFLVRLFELE